MNLTKTLQLYYWINDYIIHQFSNFDNVWNEIVLKKKYVSDLAKLNNIIGRLEIYIVDKKDKENGVYMVEWFKKEMESRDFIYEDFIEWAEEQEKLQSEINRWVKCARKLGGLMLDQTKISGIGVAWGSEILFRAGLRPDMRACDQNLNKLVESMVTIREKIKKVYSEQVSEDNCKQFINEWYVNLYDIREMEIYKKGSKLEVLGRSWWV
jgi:formamidopyrimidine-DNA glycosylase